MWAREDDGLLDEHYRTDRARKTEQDDDCEHLEHEGRIVGCDTLGIGQGVPVERVKARRRERTRTEAGASTPTASLDCSDRKQPGRR